MDFRVIISKRALRDLKDILKFIAKDDPARASDVGEKLLKKSFDLSVFPLRHALCPGRDDLRKVPMSPYIIYYRVNEEKKRVTILHFWHSARQDPML